MVTWSNFFSQLFNGLALGALLGLMQKPDAFGCNLGSYT